MPYVSLSTNAHLYYDDTGGNGVPLILVHGMLGTAALHFKQLTPWLKSLGYRVIGPTMRGYGQSTPKPRDFPNDFYHRDARDLIAFMDALGLESAHLLGYSDGGEIVVIMGALVPYRVRSVVSWGAVGYFGAAMRPVIQRMYPATWMTDEERRVHGIDSPDAFALSWMQAVKAMIDAGGDVSLSIAHQITAPLLLMLGDQDTLNPAEYGQRLVDRVPDGRLQVLPCGHPVHEQAYEGFTAAVGPFLADAQARWQAQP